MTIQSVRWFNPRYVILIAVGLLWAAPSSDAQGEQDKADILESLDTFFSGLAERDTLVMREVVDKGSRLVITSFDAAGKPAARRIPMRDFMRIISREGPPIREEFWEPEIRIHDNLATVWVRYNFYISGRIDHCGEDTFQMFRGPERWIILAVADTQRRTGCTERNP